MIIMLKVTPNAKRAYCKIDKGGSLKCFVKGPAQDGKANDELIAFVAASLKLPKSAVCIVKGHSARLKILGITTSLTLEEITKKLCEE